MCTSDIWGFFYTLKHTKCFRYHPAFKTVNRCIIYVHFFKWRAQQTSPGGASLINKPLVKNNYVSKFNPLTVQSPYDNSTLDYKTSGGYMGQVLSSSSFVEIK